MPQRIIKFPLGIFLVHNRLVTEGESIDPNPLSGTYSEIEAACPARRVPENNDRRIHLKLRKKSF